MNWNIRSKKIPKDLEELKAILLANRHLDQDELFFSPVSPSEISPESVAIDRDQLDQAVDRLQRAIDDHKLIVVFGDYDADGICATAVMWQTLYDLGAQVEPFIPNREKHGYGISKAALDDLLANSQPDVIVTVDNGIVAHQPAKRVMDEGIDLIITDHHQPEETLPFATAIVHTDQLCGTTVAWMVARELSRRYGKHVTQHLDLCGIATIADQVPLRDANRSFAKAGIEALRQTSRCGLQQLFKEAQIEQTKITSQSVGYAIAPRINAMGRLGDSLDALRLLLTTDPQRAKKLASLLQETNSDRQDLTYQMLEEALADQSSWEKQSLIIVQSEEYHEGVIGLIAGRLTEQFYKPSIAMSISDSVVKASARSVPGVNIIKLIRQVKSDLLDVGGHPMAAGFGLERTKLADVTAKLQKLAKEQIDQQLLQPQVEVEAVIRSNLISVATVEMINKFAPFGSNNEQPILGITDVEILEVMTMGRDNHHLKIVGRIGDGVTPMNFLAWRQGALAAQLRSGQHIDIAGVLEINEWRNKRSVQVRVEDIRFDE